jgi:excisionase family DNA binding protein
MRDTRPLATREEVADYLKVPPRTLEQWAYRGKGPEYTLIGRHARYSWASVERWLDGQRTNAGGGAAA